MPRLSAFFTALGLVLFLMGALWAFAFPAGSPDKALSAFFAAEPIPTLTPAVTLLTSLNSPPAVLLALLVVLTSLLYRHRWREASFALTAVAGSALANAAIKSLVARPRPEIRLIEIASPSFPSWHSTTSAALALTLWLIFVRPLPAGQRKNLLSCVLLLWPLLIGFSRLYLDVHWFSDILAGWGLGLLLTTLASAAILGNGRKIHAST